MSNKNQSNNIDVTNVSAEIQKKAIEQYLKNQLTAKRASAKYTLILKKAKDAGITVSEEEIKEYLASKV